MNSARDQLFPGSSLTQNQDCRIRRRDQSYLLQYGFQSRAFSDNCIRVGLLLWVGKSAETRSRPLVIQF